MVEINTNAEKEAKCKAEEAAKLKVEEEAKLKAEVLVHPRGNQIQGWLSATR